MPFYESIVIARQDVSAAQVETLTDEFAGQLTEAGGTIGRREYWGLKSLSYRIKKNRKGHYVLLNFDAPAEAVHEMERKMRLSEDILRYMTIRMEDMPEGPSVIMQRRDERDSRDSRDGRGDRGDRGDRGPRRDSRSDSDDAPSASAKSSEGDE